MNTTKTIESIREQFTREVVLRDGSTVHLRPARDQDASALRQFIQQLPRQDVSDQRATLPMFDPKQLNALLMADSGGCFVLVGELHDRIIAVGGYTRDQLQPDVAQSIFATDPTVQGKGLGTALLDHLADIARHHGIHWLEGDVYATNRRMLNLIAATGFEVVRRRDGGFVRVRLNLEPTSAYQQRVSEQQEQSVAVSVRIFFEPRSVAVVGASSDEEKIGSVVLHNLITNGYTGEIYPINPRGGDIQGRRSYAM